MIDPAMETLFHCAKRNPTHTLNTPTKQAKRIKALMLLTRRYAVAEGRMKNPITITAPTALNDAMVNRDTMNMSK